MRSGLVIFGVLFFLFAGLLYLLSAGASASLRSAAGVQQWTAMINLPWPTTIGLMLLGLVLFILGITLPDKRVVVEKHVIEPDEKQYHR